MKAYLRFFKEMLGLLKNWNYLVGILLMLVGFSVGIYKGCVLQNYWTTSRWDEFTEYPLLSVISFVCILTGYVLCKFWNDHE